MRPLSEFGTGLSHFIIQGAKNLDLQLFSAINKILAEQSAGAGIHFGQSGKENGFLFIVIPLGEDQVDKFVHPRRFRAGGIGLRNNDFRNRGHHRVLLRVERSQHGLFRQLRVHSLEHRKGLSR